MGHRSATARVLEQAAEVGQQLGAAAWFGGQLFATTGLHPGVQVLADRGERTKVIDEAWRRYRPYGTAGLWLAKASTALRTYLLAREPEGGRPTALVTLNLACAAGAVASASAAAYLGKRIAAASPDAATPITTATEPSDETPPRAQEAQRWLGVSEGFALAFGVGLVVTSALLDRAERDDAGAHGGRRAAEPHFGGGRQPGVAGVQTPETAVSPTAGRQSPFAPEMVR
ncbi:MAG TPA: hypothetical protein VF406_18900 [Thermodesulfobacteriota bacterium]